MKVEEFGEDTEVRESSEATHADAAEKEPVTETAETAEESETSKDDVEKQESEEKKPEAKKGGFQRRIEKLNSKIQSAEQEKEYWRQEALRNSKPAEAKSEADIPKELKRPRLSDYSGDDAVGQWEDAMDAYNDKKVAKIAADLFESRQKQEAQKTEQQQRAEQWDEKVDAAREAYEDYDEKTEHLRIPPVITEPLLKSRIGAHIGYFLADHPDEVKRIGKLPSIEAAIEIGRIEAYIESEAEGDEEAEKEPPKKTEPPISKAPPPLSPAKKTSQSTRSIYDENITPEEYRNLREAQSKG